MSELKINPNRRFLRPEKLPHFFCAGCGCGQVLNYYTQALDELHMDPEQMLREDGIKAGVLKLCNVWPVPERQIREAAREVRKLFAVEMNIGKYAGEIERVASGICGVSRITKNLGLIHTPTEIYQAVKEDLK